MAPDHAAVPGAAGCGRADIGDRRIARLGLGAMRLTGPGSWGPPADPEECRRVLRRAVGLGVTFIDTADSYGPEISEQLIAEALWPYGEELTIATKGGLVRDGPGEWRPDGRPEHLRAACEGSLRRLKLDQVPLYQLHRPDPRVPLEESLGALAELRATGKIAHIGLSNVDTEQLVRAQRVVPVASVQNRFNIADRTSDEVLEACEAQGIVFIPWNPLDVDGRAAASSALDAVARRHHVTPAAAALAWLLTRSPVMVPIPGTARVSHLEQNMAACGVRLDDDDISILAQV